MCSPIDGKYKAMVLDIIARESGEIIENYSMEHANFLAEQMFDRTEESISILTGELFPEDAPHARAAFCRMVARLAQKPRGTLPAVRIITTRLDTLPVWVTPVVSKHETTINIIRAHEKDPENPKLFHFFAADGRMFRYEKPHRPQAKVVHAQVGFHNPDTTAELQAQFDGLWSRFTAARDPSSEQS